MPELPEVQTVVSQLNPEISGLQIGKITFNEGKLLKPSPDEFINQVSYSTIRKVERLAKIIVLEVEKENHDRGVILIHLKMTGRLLVRDTEDENDPYTQVVFTLLDLHNNQKELRYTSSRKFGYLKYLSLEEFNNMKEQSYGPDAILELNLELFNSILEMRSKKIKDVLIDQSLIAGIGNIYANDALWLAGIMPSRSSKTLDKSDAKRLFESLKDVLREGLQKGGASDNWFRNAYGEKGSYQENFKIYGKKGDPCSHCRTIIKYEKIGGRGTFYCEMCQK